MWVGLQLSTDMMLQVSQSLFSMRVLRKCALRWRPAWTSLHEARRHLSPGRLRLQILPTPSVCYAANARRVEASINQCPQTGALPWEATCAASQVPCPAF